MFDAYAVAQFFGILVLITSIIVAIWALRSYESSTRTFGLAATAAVVAVAAACAPMLFPSDNSGDYEFKAKYELEDFSVLDLDKDKWHTDSDAPLMLYFYDVDGVEKDFYAAVVAKPGNEHDYRIVSMERGATVLEDLRKGERPYVEINAKPTTGTSYFGHEVDRGEAFEYIVHIDRSSMATGDDYYFKSKGQELKD